MWTLVTFIARTVVSFVITLYMAVESSNKPNLVEFALFWCAIYVMISMYFHVRRFIKEEEEGEILVMRNVLLDMILGYIVMPLGMISMAFVGLPELVALIFPDEWKETVQMIVGGTEMLGLLVYDIWKVKEDYGEYRELKKNSDGKVPWR